MKNEVILKKAISRAVKNGFDCGSDNHGGWDSCVKSLTEDWERPELYSIIFSHSFAKAFWVLLIRKKSNCHSTII